MFQSARLKLTGWYLLIIMMISGVFSAVIYTGINQEYNHIEEILNIRLEREQQLGLQSYFEIWRQERMMRGLPTPISNATSDLQVIQGARTRLQFTLLVINLAILGIAGFLSYFLAGRTLRPIRDMLDEQTRFITDASHELRTPLSSLKTEIEVNLRDKNIAKTTKDILNSNLEEVNKLQILSDNLIKLSQYQKINNHSKFEKVSIKEIIELAQKQISVLAKNKNIQIISNIKDQRFQVDKNGLVEAIVIFLDNAIKYSPPNTVVKINSQKTDHQIKIDISDQGIGIEKADLPHLFDRFYRADKSRSKGDISGFGLGLSIAKQIIDKHQGDIEVKSKAGEGTTFSITLPIKHSAQVI